MLAVLVWLVTVQALAIAVLPLTCRVFRALPDRGYGFSKLIGLLLIGYLAWLSSMLGFTDFTRPPSTAIVLVVAVACWWIWGQECRVGLAARWRIVLLLETAFLLALGAAILVRAYNGDIVGQEKFMDFALMNAFLSAPDLPAEDPWLAGFGMPYYHFGYLLLGLPAKLSGTPGPVTYNLAVALVFANAFLGVTSIVYGLLARAEPREPGGVDTRALLFGFLGAAMAMLMGNLEGVLELVAAAGWGSGSFWQAVGVKGLGVGMGGATPPLDGAWWWRASRVIPNIQPDGITEFPYFSYLLGDLHPHYTAIPLDLAIVALAVAPWLDRREAESLPRTVVAAIVLGALIAANTWDVPTFFGLLLLAGALEAWRRSGSAADLRRRVAFVLAPPVLAPLAVAPYFVGYESQRLGLGVVGERTPLASMLILFGPALIVTLALAGWMRLDKPNPLTPFPEGKGGPLELLPLPFREGGWGVRLAAGAALGALLLLQEPTLVMLGLVGMALGWAGWPWLRAGSGWPSRREASALFAWLLACVSVAVLVGVELFYVRDVFGTRMNTVFKLHYDAWVLLAIAGATALGLLWSSGRATWRRVTILLVALVLGPGLVYPLAATWTKSDHFQIEPTLDGARFLRRGSPSDLDAIEWLRANAGGRPIVIEAVGPDYELYARVSTFSGLPTIVGWVGHELQWRGERPELIQRQRDVDAIYRAETVEALSARAEPYHARFLVFGTLERSRYGPEAQQRLGRLLPIAFGRGGTTVYSLPTQGQAERTR